MARRMCAPVAPDLQWGQPILDSRVLCRPRASEACPRCFAARYGGGGAAGLRHLRRCARPPFGGSAGYACADAHGHAARYKINVRALPHAAPREWNRLGLRGASGSFFETAGPRAGCLPHARGARTLHCGSVSVRSRAREAPGWLAAARQHFLSRQERSSANGAPPRPRPELRFPTRALQGHWRRAQPQRSLCRVVAFFAEMKQFLVDGEPFLTQKFGTSPEATAERLKASLPRAQSDAMPDATRLGPRTAVGTRPSNGDRLQHSARQKIPGPPPTQSTTQSHICGGCLFCPQTGPVLLAARIPAARRVSCRPAHPPPPIASFPLCSLTSIAAACRSSWRHMLSSLPRVRPAMRIRSSALAGCSCWCLPCSPPFTAQPDHLVYSLPPSLPPTAIADSLVLLPQATRQQLQQPFASLVESVNLLLATTAIVLAHTPAERRTAPLSSDALYPVRTPSGDADLVASLASLAQADAGEVRILSAAAADRLLLARLRLVSGRAAEPGLGEGGVAHFPALLSEPGLTAAAAALDTQYCQVRGGVPRLRTPPPGCAWTRAGNGRAGVRPDAADD